MITKGGREVKRACFTFEGLSSFATSLNSYYLYFFMRDRFGFGNKDNLAFAALNGLIYTFSAWQAGRFAQRHGYFTALKIGFGVMILALAVGSQCHSAAGVIVATGAVQRRHVFPLADHRGARQRRRRRRQPAARRRHLQPRLGLHQRAGPVQRRHAGGSIRVQNHLLPAARPVHRATGG